MEFRKTDPALFDLVQELVAAYPCDFRKMFGCPACFVKGNMFAGAFGDAVFLRLSEDDRKKITALSNEIRPFEPMPGRIMREYIAIPEGLFDGRSGMEEWVAKAYRYATTLTPKKAKTVKTVKAAKAAIAPKKKGRRV